MPPDNPKGNTVWETHIVYFFVPLLEPLGLPGGISLPFLYRPAFDEFVQLNSEQRRAIAEEGVLDASLKIHQASYQSDTDMGIMEACFKVATQAVPGSQRHGSDTVTQTRAIEITIVELAIPCSLTDDEDQTEVLSAAFDKGLEAIRTLQRAYHAAAYRPVELVARETLPIAVPMSIRDVTPDSQGGWSGNLNLFLVNMNLGGVRTSLSDLEMERFADTFRSWGPERPFTTFFDLRREARQALLQRGERRMSVVLAAAAAEALFNDLLLMLMWEERMAPRQAGRVFIDRRGVSDRVASQYGRRVGGSWHLDRPGPIHDWSTKLARLRNRVLHAGREPSIRETRDAVQALDNVVDFIAGRLVHPKTLRKYPRTTLLALGKYELTARNQWSKRLDELTTRASEPDWLATFARWRAVADSEQVPIEPAVGRAQLVAVTWPDGSVHWWLHDRETNRVRAARTPELQPEHAASEYLTTPPDAATSIAILGIQTTALPHSRWLDAHEVLPLAGVYVDGSDLAQAAALWAQATSETGARHAVIRTVCQPLVDAVARSWQLRHRR